MSATDTLCSKLLSWHYLHSRTVKTETISDLSRIVFSWKNQKLTVSRASHWSHGREIAVALNFYQPMIGPQIIKPSQFSELGQIPPFLHIAVLILWHIVCSLPSVHRDIASLAKNRVKTAPITSDNLWPTGNVTDVSRSSIGRLFVFGGASSLLVHL